jgi:hypothetical protein
VARLQQVSLMRQRASTSLALRMFRPSQVWAGQGSIHSITLAMVMMAAASRPNCRWLAQPG